MWTLTAADGSDQVNLTNASIFDADPSWSPDGTHIAFVRDAGGQNFNVWTALADGSGQVNLTGIGGRNSFPDWGPTPSSLTASISIAGPESSDPGAASAPIDGIPLDAIRGQSQTTAGAPLGGIPLGGIPLGGIPLGGIPLGGIPLGGIGFTAENLSQNGLGGVPLSSIPLVLPDTWEAHLALEPAFKGTPPQNVTLAQVLGTQVVAGITLDKLNLASSPLGGIPLAGIALGGLPLGGIPLGGIAGTPPDQNLTDWCHYVNQQPGFTCPNGQSLGQQTMLGLALQGVPLGGIPLGGIPLGGIPLGGIPLGGIPVGTPLGGIPLGGINLVGTPLGGIPLGGIDMSPNASPLGGITLGLIPQSAKIAIFDCPTGNFLCADTDTLAQAKAAGAIKQTAKLQDLGYYKNANGQDITLKDLVRGLPPDTTLEDLLATVLLKTAYDWEQLPLPGFPLQDFSTDGGTATYTVSFQLDGAGPPVDGSVAVHVGADARYVTGSTTLSGGPGSVDEPTLRLPENELNWHLTNVQLGTSYQLTFHAKPGLSLGTESATAKIAATGLNGTVQAPEAASTQITEPGEPANGQPETAQPAQPDTLYLGYTSSGSDRDYFQVHANPGEQLTIHLSHLKVDDDLVIYGPGIAPLRTPHPGAEAPSAGDVPFDLGQRTQSITPEALTDVPQDAVNGQTALDVSDNRGLADEEVSVGLTRGWDVHDPGRELRRGLQQRSVGAADREIALDRAAAHVHQPAGPRHGRHQGDACRADDREHPLSLRLEALRRPLRAPGRERRLQPAADTCGSNGRGRGRGDPGRRQRRRTERPQCARRGLLLAREGQRRRAGRRQPARQPADRPAVGQVHRRRGRRRRRRPVRARPRQLRVRERARVREHVLRRHEQPVPEHVRARLPADRRPARRRQLLGPGAVRPRARGRAAGRDPDPDPQPDHPVHHPERRDQPDEGPDDRLRLPLGRRVAGLGGLQGQAGDEQRAGADQQLLVQEQPARGDVPDLEPADSRLDQRALRPCPRPAGRRERRAARVDPLHDRRSRGPLDERAGHLHDGLPLGPAGIGLRLRQLAQRRLGAGVRAERSRRVHGQHGLRPRRHRGRALLRRS